MNYRKIPFHEYKILQSHVLYIYEITSEKEDSYFTIPNGTIGLSIVINGSAKISYKNNLEIVPKAMIFGMIKQVQKVEFGSGIREITIGFKPDKLQQFLPETMSRFSAGVLTSIDNVFDKYKVEKLVTEVTLANNDHQILDAIDVFLTGELKDRRQSSALQAALKLIEDEQFTCVQKISDMVGLSGTSVRNLFREQVGLSPKEYIKICRVMQALHYKDIKKMSVTKLAYHLGYYDQAHFIHEFKEVTGLSPLHYFKSDELTCDFYNFGHWRSDSFV